MNKVKVSLAKQYAYFSRLSMLLCRVTIYSVRKEMAYPSFLVSSESFFKSEESLLYCYRIYPEGWIHPAFGVVDQLNNYPHSYLKVKKKNPHLSQKLTDFIRLNL